MSHYTKWFGGEWAPAAAEIFEECGIKTYVLENATTCELAKVLDTARYGWEIIWVKEVARICENFDVDWQDVHAEWTKTYNQLYDSDSGYHRSSLTPVPGPIGGHCVIPNLDLLDDWMTRLIQTFNDDYKELAA